MQWHYQRNSIHNGVITRWFQGDQHLSYYQVLTLLQQNQAFCALFIDSLKALPFKAYKWETPALSEVQDRDFEYVVLNTPSLDRPQNIVAFADFLTAATRCQQFTNLGGDATLVCPPQLDNTSNYCHLASFTASAALSQQIAFWQSVAQTMQQNLCDQPRWLSTAGEGVPWLHIRIDQRPKYYGYSPYRNI